MLLLFSSCLGKENKIAQKKHSTKNPQTSQVSQKNTHTVDLLEIFISTSGNDNNSGSKNSPLLTLERAFAVISGSKRTSIATIYIRGGNYHIAHPITIDGLKFKRYRKISVEAEDDRTVTISGATVIPNSHIKPFKKNILSFKLPSEDSVQIGSLNPTGFKDPKVPSAMQLYVNNMPYRLARWPNSGLLPIGKVVQRGERRNYSNPTKDAHPKFKYAFDRPNAWKSNDIWIAGRMSVGWSYDNLPVANIYRAQKLIELKQSASYGVYSSSDSSKSDIKFARKNRGYFFYNIFEELDATGEWYMSPTERTIYFWQQDNKIGNSLVEVSNIEEPLLTINNSNSTYLTFKNVTFTKGRGILVLINNSANILFDKVTFSNSGLQGARLNSCSNIQIINSKIFNNGAGGLILTGGNRKNLTPGNLTIQNCEFFNFSERYRTYSPAINLQGVGNIVRNCYIHNGPGHAITFTGNNHQISNNRIENMCSEFSDIGAIYTGRDPSSTGTIIRDNYFNNIGNNLTNMVAALYIDDGSGGFKIENNVFQASGYSGKDALGAIHINGGTNNLIRNNIFIDCPKAYSSISWTKQKWDNTYRGDATNLKKITEDVNINSAEYLKQYPHLKNFLNKDKSTEKNTVVNTVILGENKSLKSGNNFNIINTAYANFVDSKKNASSNNPAQSTVAIHNIVIPQLPEEINNWKDWKMPDVPNMGLRP